MVQERGPGRGTPRFARNRRAAVAARWPLVLLTLFVLTVAALYGRSTGLRAEPARAEPNSAPAASPAPRLSLEIIDGETGNRTPARFSLYLDDRPFFPETVGPHGLRFVSVHEAKQQTYVVTYARGSGPVDVELPAGAGTVEVRAVKGFEFLPASRKFHVKGGTVGTRVTLHRWIDLEREGWLPADEHVHYDRLNQDMDRDWLTMLAADGLAHAHFMILKGGKVPGIWARQYAYGKEGEAFDGTRWIRSGEEYRDTLQGHINLLGIDEIIPPISTGGLGSPPVITNDPPFHDVFLRCRELHGLGGVAHGGAFGREPVAVVDTVLGAVDFFEIGNAFLRWTELWYRLMNSGYLLPPAAGTDLPNVPFRDDWQPFLGSVRMYVKLGEERDFEAWKQAVRRGAVFVTSGPLLTFTVNGLEAGNIVRLPDGGAPVTVEAELASPVGLRGFELVRNGVPVPCRIEKITGGSLHRWRLRLELRIDASCWLAVRGEGVPIQAFASLKQGAAAWVKTDAWAHSAAIPVEVGGRPIRSQSDIEFLLDVVRRGREYYRSNGRYEQGAHRLRALELFEQAANALEHRLDTD